MQAWVSGFLTSLTEYHGMRLLIGFFAAFFLLSCGLSVDTRVADNPVTRMAIVHSIKLGQTTPAQLIAQWMGLGFVHGQDGLFQADTLPTIDATTWQGVVRSRRRPPTAAGGWRATVRPSRPFRSAAHVESTRDEVLRRSQWS